MKKTSIAVPDQLWRRFRALNIVEGRESQEVITKLIEEYLKKKESKDGKRNGSR